MKKIQLSLLLTLFLISFSTHLFAQILTKLHDFNAIDGGFSRGNNLISDDEYFYGMTTFGGTSEKGTIFKIRKDGTEFSKLHDFNITNGSEPYNSLILINSELYGVTLNGGMEDKGVIFKINTDGTNFTKIFDFAGNTASLPQSSLHFDGTYLYGTSYHGGSGGGGGTVYKIKPDGSEFSILYSFITSDPGNGNLPQFDFEFDPQSNYFYGVTFKGGLHDKGTIYRITTDGSYQKLHDFNGENGDNAGELMIADEYIFGTTYRGGSNDKGVIYKMKKDGSEFTKLHDFETATGTESFTKLSMLQDYLYGMTISGGTGGGGVIFRIKTDGTDYSNVYTFSNNSGYSPWASLYLENEEFYGLTQGGGSFGVGTIFKFDPDGELSVSENNLSDLSLFPNPAKDKLYINLTNNYPSEISIYDVTGKLILKKSLKIKSTEIDISYLKKGIYLIQSGNKIVKFLKE